MKLFFPMIVVLFAFLAPVFAFDQNPRSTTFALQAPILFAQTQDPLQDEQAVQSRIETGSPSETLIDERNGGFLMAGFIILMILLLIGSILYVSRAPKPDPSRHSS